MEKTPTKSVPSTEYDQPPAKRIAPAPALASEGEPKKSTRPARLIPDVRNCNICKYKAADHDSLMEHVTNSHQELLVVTRPARLIPDVRNCNICKYKAADHDSLMDHLTNCHQDLLVVRRKFVCKICFGAFITDDDLHDHVNQLHLDNSVSQVTVTSKLTFLLGDKGGSRNGRQSNQI